jgi:hypothetical protein
VLRGVPVAAKALINSFKDLQIAEMSMDFKERKWVPKSGLFNEELVDESGLERVIKRLIDLPGEIAEAEEACRQDEVEKFHKERDGIIDLFWVTTGVRLHGGKITEADLPRLVKRLRRFRPDSPAEREAEALRKAIDRVKKRLKTEMPRLFEHLRKCVMKGGTTFAYYPPRPAPEWDL